MTVTNVEYNNDFHKTILLSFSFIQLLQVQVDFKFHFNKVCHLIF